ncbi:MAG: hypothetical protein HYZ53_14860 [Planctomycetes bacterium]|nr:hypothetical protein [Planctomycetota bacterium]
MSVPRVRWVLLACFLLGLTLPGAEAKGGGSAESAIGHALDGWWRLDGQDRFGPYKGTVRVQFLNGNLYRLEGAPAYADGVSRNWCGEALLINRKLSLSHTVPANGMLEALTGQAPPTDLPPRISRTYDLDREGLNLTGVIRLVQGPVKTLIGRETLHQLVPPLAGFEKMPATEGKLTVHVWRSAPSRLRYGSPLGIFGPYLVNHARKSKHSIGHVAVEVRAPSGTFARGNYIYAGHTGDPEPMMIKAAKRGAPLREVFGTFPGGHLHTRVPGDEPHVTVEFKLTKEQAVAALEFVTQYKQDHYGLFPNGATSSADIVKAGIEDGGGCISFGAGVLTQAGIDLSTLHPQTVIVSKTWMEEGGYRWWMLPFYSTWCPRGHTPAEITFYTPDLLADWVLDLPPAIKQKFDVRILKAAK